MNKHILSILTSSALLLAGLCACHDSNFHINGEIEGAKGQKMSLEKSDFYGRWISLDSIKIGNNGKFSFSFPASSAPEIYRLALDNRYIYFPVDSTETLTLTSSLEGFGRDFNISGSDQAERLEKFEVDLLSLGDLSTVDEETLDNFKKKVFSTYIKDFPGSVVNFYILTKTNGDMPLYDPKKTKDAKYFGAVATGFKALRPNDPRTALLERTTIEAMKKRNAEAGNYLAIEANEISVIDIELQDNSGKTVKLSDVVGKGKPVALIFSVLTHEDSPELNYGLAQIYNKKNGAVEFYNVSFDPDQYEWREASGNLPWINVYANDPGKVASLYNVVSLPTFFVYNSAGELVSRPGSLKELEEALK